MLIRKKKQWAGETLIHLGLSAIMIGTLLSFMPTLLTANKLLFILSIFALLFVDLYLIASRKYHYLKIVRKILLVLSFIVFGGIVIYYLSSFIVYSDQHGMEQVLRDHASVAKWIFALVCFLQPIILPLPEAVTVPAGSVVLGSLMATLISFVSTTLGILVMFLIARYGGQKLALKLVKEKQLRKYQLFVSKNETVILTLLFIIPILPDEIISVGAGISKVSFKKFIIISAISKLITSSLLSYSIELAKFLSLTPSQFVMTISLGIASVFLVSFYIQKRLSHQNEKNNA
ncbi:VTT domain-containing protein [Cytobacillus spongiae]|jgi:uncharacterized membrane protein YdjX (TVP38/TMEM64 family)|uniref:TVP38/TMEM64 family protein n=1 Tax=Cytobacillus spongiae TaxID=2901381 RepID=UPI001F3EFFBC|nr:VTT domain-containing protein [Cytobacillus spongiae]UII57027.1 VTT domain-containing protein [Cytobacillus spongiae]